MVYAGGAGCSVRECVYVWAPGLGGVPDEPHAANVSASKTEGSGVGVTTEPPVNAKLNYPAHFTLAPPPGHKPRGPSRDGDAIGTALASEAQGAWSLCFKVTLAERMEVTWETLLAGERLFVEIPTGILPAGSKER